MEKEMKKRILSLFAIVAVLGLAIAVYAYAQTTTAAPVAAASCCDSCPMKNKKDGGEHRKGHEMGEGHKCCGDSCPMKGEHGKSGDHKAKGEAHNCCGDSCPMKKKDGEAKGTAVSMTEGEKGCCDCCDCCKGKEKTKVAEA